MSGYARSACGFALLVSGLAMAALALMGWRRPPSGDEIHFYETIRLFGHDAGLGTLARYNEMSTPLPFLLYALWGKAFGFGIHILRLFSVLVAIATALAFHRLLFAIWGARGLVPAVAGLLVFNPYAVYLSLFVYTDMLGILFLLLASLAVLNEKPLHLAVSGAAGLLCRQHLLFLLGAAAVYFLLRWRRTREPSSRVMLMATLASLAPLVALTALWGGLAPDNAMRRVYATEGFVFHPRSLTLYVCQITIYLAPLLVFCWRPFYANLRVLLPCLAASFAYRLAPVAPSRFARMSGILTVGFFHRFLRLLTSNPHVEHAVFQTAFFLALPVLVYLARDGWTRVREGRIDFALFLDLAIAFFLVEMPFAYLHWEKYFLPILPLLAVRILLARVPPDRASRFAFAILPPL